jgi:hypothetical protein
MSAPVYITAAQLEAAGACAHQFDKFLRLFPDGRAEVTVKRAVQLAGEFNWYWAACNLLKAGPLAAFNAAMAGPRAAYNAAMAGPRSAYDAARVEAEAAYNAARAGPRAAYAAAMAGPRAAYNAAMAEAFARAYIKQEQGQ